MRFIWYGFGFLIAKIRKIFHNILLFLKYFITLPRRTNEMSKYEIPFLTTCIRAFGRRFDLTRQAAFHYLYEHKGLAFLIEFYDVEHLQSIDETIDDLLIVCKQNGGLLT